MKLSYLQPHPYEVVPKPEVDPPPTVYSIWLVDIHNKNYIQYNNNKKNNKKNQLLSHGTQDVCLEKNINKSEELCEQFLFYEFISSITAIIYL